MFCDGSTVCECGFYCTASFSRASFEYIVVISTRDPPCCLEKCVFVVAMRFTKRVIARLVPVWSHMSVVNPRCNDQSKGDRGRGPYVTNRRHRLCHRFEVDTPRKNEQKKRLSLHGGGGGGGGGFFFF